MSIAKFTEIQDSTQRDAYVHQLLHDEPDPNTFKSSLIVADELKTLDADSLVKLTEWVITSMASWKSGDFMDDRPVMEFQTAYESAKDGLQASPDQLQELDILWLTRIGAERYVYAELPQKVKDGYEARLTAFLGEDSAIDTIDSMENARKVAFELFSGRRSNLGLSRSILHLNHMLHVAEEADLATIQYVMRNVRQKQWEYYKNHGFLKENSDHPIPPYTVDPLKNRDVEVVIVGGEQLIQSFMDGESNGAYFDDEFPGLRVILRKKDDPDFVQKALDSAQKHFDEAVILVASVAEKYLVPIASSNDFKLYPEALTSLNIRHTVNVPYSLAHALETKDVFAPLQGKPNYKTMYIGPDANPHKDAITRLIDTPAKDFILPDIPRLHLDPPPEDAPESGWKTYATGAAVILGVFFAYKYVVRPNYPKLIEWWNTRKASANA